MGFVQASDIKGLLQDPELTLEIAKAVVEDQDVLDSLADEIAEEISDEMENAPELRKQIIAAAMASPDFKRKLVKAIVDDD
jgi:hypothetical protein